MKHRKANPRQSGARLFAIFSDGTTKFQHFVLLYRLTRLFNLKKKIKIRILVSGCRICRLQIPHNFPYCVCIYNISRTSKLERASIFQFSQEPSSIFRWKSYVISLGSYSNYSQIFYMDVYTKLIIKKFRNSKFIILRLVKWYIVRENNLTPFT